MSELLKNKLEIILMKFDIYFISLLGICLILAFIILYLLWNINIIKKEERRKTDKILTKYGLSPDEIYM